MHIRRFLAVSAIATTAAAGTSLLAVPAHAQSLPYYQCQVSGFTYYMNFRTNIVIGEGCTPENGAPTSGQFTETFEIVSPQQTVICLAGDGPDPPQFPTTVSGFLCTLSN